MSDDDEEEGYGSLCTFAATGTKPHFQAIYLCHTCSKHGVNHEEKEEDDDGNDTTHKTGQKEEPLMSMPLCVCHNCAIKCHEEKGHDIEYVGDGKAYCDCASFSKNEETKEAGKTSNNYISDEVPSKPFCPSTFCGCCTLEEKSKEVAMKLNICDSNGNICSDLGVNVNILKRNIDNESKGETFPFVCDVYAIPSLSSRPCYRLVQQALELVKHTRDTHWVSMCSTELTTDMRTSTDTVNGNEECQHGKKNIYNLDFDEMCELEQFAYSIFQRHLEAYDLMQCEDNEEHDIGAEWWVQVKEMNDQLENQDSTTTMKNSAIDLHYDKDEELAAAFDIGSFPTLSTVTYLTEAFGRGDEDGLISAPPTLVFAHTHEMMSSGPMGQNAYIDDGDIGRSPQMMMSHPREGKHLCFDGRLLHGASSNLALRQVIKENDEEMLRLEKNRGELRVTFLVNIWLTRRPSRVVTLPDHIRSAIKSCSITPPIDLSSQMQQGSTLEMYPREIKICHIGGDEGTANGQPNGIERIMLPFVSSNATWINGDDNSDDNNNDNDDDSEDLMDESGLLVSIIPPPPSTYPIDTTLVFYEENLEPHLEHIWEDEEYDSHYESD